MDGKGARGKGARGEREIVAKLTEMGFDAVKISGMYTTGADIFVSGHLAEVKRQESMSKRDWEWLEQTEEAELLFKRVNGKKWLVVMDLETFAKVVPH